MPQVIYETAYVFYNAYKGPKCIYKTFIDRVRRRKLPMMEAIVPKAIPNTKRSPERIFYEEYQGTKACYWTYISRIGTGLSREEAILPEKRKPEFIRVYRAPTYTPTYNPTYKEKILSPRAVIDITLSSAEAEVFRKEYKRLKADLEHRLATCESPTLHLQLEHELKGLVEEITVFNQRN